jgi:tRNA pseudouridine32 synthase / 23S rRNA pseudouridine746 synthase
MHTANKNYFQFSITLNDAQVEKLPCDAASLLASETGLSKQKIKSAMKQGAVWLTQGKTNKRLRQENFLLKFGDKLDIYYDENLLRTQPAQPVLIKDEGAYSVWYKPYGLLAQGSLWGDSHAIDRYAELNLTPQRPALVVHRLDREAQGLMLLAHNKKIARYLSQLFQDRQVTKHYRALVQGNIVQGNMGSEKIILNKNIDGKTALTTVTPLHYDKETNRSLLSINIETGRKHQIRRHLSDYGFPIIGDGLYGGKIKSPASQTLQLLSVYLAFVCPLKKQMQSFSLLDTTLNNMPETIPGNVHALLSTQATSSSFHHA